MKTSTIKSRGMLAPGKAFRTWLAVLTLNFVGAGWLAAPAQAAPIQGSIDFGGVVTFDTMSLATATRVIQWNSSVVLQSSGDFSSITFGTPATMATPWIFNPSTATPALWSVGGFTFDLTSATIVSQSATFLNITGIGTITGNGYDPTPATWTFTASRSDGGSAADFGFQAQANAVPEPGAVMLVGLGALLAAQRLIRRWK